MIDVREVSQDFRSGFWLKKSRVLDRVSFSVPGHSIFGLLGANGAGKTTVMLLMVGMRRPTFGEIKIDGVDAVSLQARKRIGYLPERPYFHPHLSAIDFLKFVGDLSGIPRKILKFRIDEVLKKVGLFDVHHKELRFFSKGMLQRIGLAQAILHEPEILILDEPMSGLDPIGRREMRELISQLGKDGKTIVFSSHVISDVEALCDQIVFLQKGKMAKKGSTLDFLQSEKDSQWIDFVLRDIPFDLRVELQHRGSLEEIPEGYRITLRASHELNQMLTMLVSVGAQIIRVQPVRRSLEDALFSKSEEVLL